MAAVAVEPVLAGWHGPFPGFGLTVPPGQEVQPTPGDFHVPPYPAAHTKTGNTESAQVVFPALPLKKSQLFKQNRLLLQQPRFLHVQLQTLKKGAEQNANMFCEQIQHWALK